MRRRLQSGEFHGRPIGTLRHAGLTFAETEYEPGHRLPEHAHDRPFFSLLLRGDFRERAERRVRHCVPTSLVFYPEHEPHEEAFGEAGGRGFHVELGHAWLDRMREEGMTYASGSSETLDGRQNLLVTRLYACLACDGAGIGAEEIVLDLLAGLTRVDGLGHETAPPAWLARVREMLHERYAEALRVTDLADEAGVHPVHLARVFRHHVGCTIGDYVRDLRVERACAALAEPSRSLSAIAFETGFADQAHFTRRFKQVTGFTPGRYRQVLAR